MAKIRCAHCDTAWDTDRYDSYQAWYEAAIEHRTTEHPKVGEAETWLISNPSREQYPTTEA